MYLYKICFYMFTFIINNSFFAFFVNYLKLLNVEVRCGHVSFTKYMLAHIHTYLQHTGVLTLPISIRKSCTIVSGPFPFLT